MIDTLKCAGPYKMNATAWAVLSRGILYYVVEGGLTFESVDKILKCDHSNESYGAVHVRVLYITQRKAVLTFESVDKILNCTHWNESYRAILSHVVPFVSGYGAKWNLVHI